jgi:hypothetical protein
VESKLACGGHHRKRPVGGSGAQWPLGELTRINNKAKFGNEELTG